MITGSKILTHLKLSAVCLFLLKYHGIKKMSLWHTGSVHIENISPTYMYCHFTQCTLLVLMYIHEFYMTHRILTGYFIYGTCIYWENTSQMILCNMILSRWPVRVQVLQSPTTCETTIHEKIGWHSKWQSTKYFDYTYSDYFFSVVWKLKSKPKWQLIQNSNIFQSKSIN